MKKYEVVGFGALNWDDNREVWEIVLPGKETSGRVLQGTPGGSAANTIAGLSRLGVRSAFLGAVGSDETGDYLIQDLRNEEIDSLVLSKEGASGNCLILVDGAGERSIYVFPEVNDAISIDDIFPDIKESIKNAEYFYTATFACRDSYESLETQLELARMANKFIFSPGNLYSNSESKIRIERDDIVKALLDETEILFLNEEEIMMLSGEYRYPLASENLMDAYGMGILAVTLGEKGCYVKTRDTGKIIPPQKPGRIQDTTGAGDAFAAGFIYGLVNGKGPETCGNMGNYVASRCIEETGAREGLPYLNDLPGGKSSIRIVP